MDEPTFLRRREHELRLMVGLVALTTHLAQFAALRERSGSGAKP